MTARWFAVASIFVLSHSTSTGQDKSVFSPAEVRFGDGSVVRMVLLQETIDVQTRFGKLTIPLSEIRRIDFGLHMPADVAAQVRQSIKQLGSEVYKERDAATQGLVNAGHLAFPSLQRASRSPDLETAQRAAGVIKQIAEKVAPDLLRLKEDDVIQTSDFTVVGRIASGTIKARSQHFGDMELKLPDLRTLFVRSTRPLESLSVDASKHGSSLDQWLDTGLDVDTSMKLTVRCEGVVDLWPQGPGQYMASPKGYNTAGKGGAFLAGSLVARIGENGKPFLVGERYEGTPADEGRLFLQITPSPWNNASTGAYQVRIQADNTSVVGRR